MTTYQPPHDPHWWWMGGALRKGRPLTRKEFWSALSEPERQGLRELAEEFGPNEFDGAWETRDEL